MSQPNLLPHSCICRLWCYVCVCVCACLRMCVLSLWNATRHLDLLPLIAGIPQPREKTHPISCDMAATSCRPVFYGRCPSHSVDWLASVCMSEPEVLGSPVALIPLHWWVACQDRDWDGICLYSERKLRALWVCSFILMKTKCLMKMERCEEWGHLARNLHRAGWGLNMDLELWLRQGQGYVKHFMRLWKTLSVQFTALNMCNMYINRFCKWKHQIFIWREMLLGIAAVNTSNICWNPLFECDNIVWHTAW